MDVNAFRFSPAACIAAAAWLVAAPGSALAQGQVSRTSIMVACQRAITANDPNPETRNPDYLAAKLLDAELMALVPACADVGRPFEEVFAEYLQRQARGFFAVVARTKHIDQSLQASVAEGVRQVVILGAGLDSRAYRMGPDHSGVRFFEVDLPATQEDKKQRVVRLLGSLPRNVVYVPVDFERQSLGTRLSEAGFRADDPAFFVWEGVTMYLSAEAVDATLNYIARGTAPGSSIIFDYVPAGVIDGTSTEPPAVRARRLEMLKRFGEPWLFGVPDGGIGDLVGKRGLELVSNLRIRELWDKYLRPGTADAVLGQADPEGGVALARVPARQVTDRVVTAKARPPRPAEARVAPVDEPWTVEQRDYLEPHQRADRLFNVFKTAAHHPELARSFDAFAFGYINSESLTLSPRDRELVILRIGWLCRAEYAWAAHSRIARSVGITEEELVRITRDPDAAEWRAFEPILLRAVDELHRDAFITDATWNALVERYDTRQLMDLVFTVGTYNTVSLFLNSFGVQLDEGFSGFPEGGAGAR